MEDIKLSVVFGTLNRVTYLDPLIESIRQSVGDRTYEIIIVAGPCSDGSIAYLLEKSEVEGDVRLIEQAERTGAVAAFNAGFYAAAGEYVANLNDDCRVLGDTLQRACDYLDAHAEAGQVAIPFSLPDQPPHVDHVNLWKRHICYANFGVTRKSLGRKLGWWGSQIYQYSGDTELSIKIWLENFYVVPLEGGHIVHYQLQDDTRVPNVESHRIGRLYNNSKVPDILKHLGVPRPHVTPQVHGKPSLAMQRPARILQRKTRKQLAGVEGLTLVRYLGDGWVVQGCPSGQVYHLSGGACLYVDDRDLEHVLANVPAGNTVRVV